MRIGAFQRMTVGHNLPNPVRDRFVYGDAVFPSLIRQDFETSCFTRIYEFNAKRIWNFVGKPVVKFFYCQFFDFSSFFIFNCNFCVFNHTFSSLTTR